MIIVFISCASGPQQSAPPEWIISPPESGSEYTYFVGTGSDPSGNLSAAEEEAVNFLIAEITRYIGTEVVSTTNAQAQASLNEFQANVEQTITSESSAQISGFQVVDRWIGERDGATIVYILGRYDTRELNEQKQRFEEMIQERDDAIAVPEREAERNEAQGNYMAAIRNYIEAAVAASTSQVANAEIKFERNINSAKELINRINLFPVTNDLETSVGQPFEEDFVMRAVWGTNLEGGGVENLTVNISYKFLRNNGRLGIRTETRQTDEEGYIRFTHPPAGFVGSERVTMALDFGTYIEPLRDVPRSLRSLVNALEDVVAEKRVAFEYTSVSNAAEVPTGVLVLDVDLARNPTGSTQTASGILRSLSSEDFIVQTLSEDPEVLLSMNDTQIVQLVRDNYGDRIDRIIFGIVGIEEFEERDGGYIVKVSGTIKAVDLETGQMLFSEQTFRRARGSGATSAINAAFRSLGESMGEAMANNLP